jgi:hypothetical protein
LWFPTEADRLQGEPPQHPSPAEVGSNPDFEEQLRLSARRAHRRAPCFREQTFRKGNKADEEDAIYPNFGNSISPRITLIPRIEEILSIGLLESVHL